MLDREALERFKSTVSITGVARKLGFAPVHGKMRCIEPNRHAHGDRTPSLSLMEDKGLFRCFVCEDIRGDSIELVRRVKGCSFREALEFLGAPSELLQESKNVTGVNHPAPLLSRGERGDSVRKAAKPESSLSAERRTEILIVFLRRLSKVVEKSAAAYYLSRRRIHARAWQAGHLRWIEDYSGTEASLLQSFPLSELQECGLFSAYGRMNFQSHQLVIPYLDHKGIPVFLQARSLDPSVLPKEMSLKGGIPLPFHVQALDGVPGILYLCEGAMDTLTLLERERPAVGVPGAMTFKEEWVPLFHNKKVLLTFDNDAPGRAGAQRAASMLKAGGIQAEVLENMAPGQDLNDWWRS